MSEGKKALLMCVLALLLGSIVVMSTGCVAGAGVRVNEYGAGVGAGIEMTP
jgi:hypothetical protein|tara:strand:- start:294 stop:446 length:153 start_codon:yes stop_codon:yes gene_type:complete